MNHEFFFSKEQNTKQSKKITDLLSSKWVKRVNYEKLYEWKCTYNTPMQQNNYLKTKQCLKMNNI